MSGIDDFLSKKDGKENADSSERTLASYNRMCVIVQEMMKHIDHYAQALAEILESYERAWLNKAGKLVVGVSLHQTNTYDDRSTAGIYLLLSSNELAWAKEAKHGENWVVQDPPLRLKTVRSVSQAKITYIELTNIGRNLYRLAMKLPKKVTKKYPKDWGAEFYTRYTF